MKRNKGPGLIVRAFSLLNGKASPGLTGPHRASPGRRFFPKGFIYLKILNDFKELQNLWFRFIFQ